MSYAMSTAAARTFSAWASSAGETTGGAGWLTPEMLPLPPTPDETATEPLGPLVETGGGPGGEAPPSVDEPQPIPGVLHQNFGWPMIGQT